MFSASKNFSPTIAIGLRVKTVMVIEPLIQLRSTFASFSHENFFNAVATARGFTRAIRSPNEISWEMKVRSVFVGAPITMTCFTVRIDDQPRT